MAVDSKPAPKYCFHFRQGTQELVGHPTFHIEGDLGFRALQKVKKATCILIHLGVKRGC